VKGEGNIVPTLFHPGTKEVETVDTAVEEYYGMGNPSVK